ncbi:MAG TPA: Ig-like domain-containing protein [Gemmatimonadaceae bacterium]|nr:Ig-like domain-containing protein [Gemmatimonadaceae bacterium]
MFVPRGRAAPRAITMFVASTLTVLATVTCGERSDATDPTDDPRLADSVATITITPANASVGVGATLELSALLTDSSGATVVGPSVDWTSANTGIARVRDGGPILGIVTGTAIGDVTITATLTAPSGDKVATTTVSVVPAVVANVSVVPGVLSLGVGRSEQLTAIVTDAQGNPLTGRVVQWTSTSGAVIVDDFGRVTGVFTGTATITATCEGQQGTAYITVNALSPS